MRLLQEFIHEPRVAYFSMEIALRSDIPTYAGGLGVLAGDTLRSAADLALPMVAVSLVHRRGYFRQSIRDDAQVEADALWDPARCARSLDAKIAVPIEGRAVWVSAWLYVLANGYGGRQPVLLLDTDLPENEPEDRRLTDTLYGGHEHYRLKQEIVLGVGGVRLLHAFGFQLRQYHMNEGHSALLAVELLRRFAFASEDVRPGESAYNVARVRSLCCFTTHTPVEAGHDRFDYADVERITAAPDNVAGLVDLDTLRRLAGPGVLNMTRLALALSEYVNGVAVRHAEVSRALLADRNIHAITNGVHPATWATAEFQALFDASTPGWRHEPELLARADQSLGEAALWQAHQAAKQRLLDEVVRRSGQRFDPAALTLGFARRMTSYKRPDLLFTDLERLRTLGRRAQLQLVMAGKAHPDDAEGKRLITALHRHARSLAGDVSMVFLPDYDLALAQVLVAGVDVWLNTPLPPLEASGTSGMKAAFNGVPSLSVLDGWWLEGCIEGVTGWAVGEPGGAAEQDAPALYAKLEAVIAPLWERGVGAWSALMRTTIVKNASYFNSHRMMRRYASEAYLR